MGGRGHALQSDVDKARGDEVGAERLQGVSGARAVATSRLVAGGGAPDRVRMEHERPVARAQEGEHRLVLVPRGVPELESDTARRGVASGVDCGRKGLEHRHVGLQCAWALHEQHAEVHAQERGT